MKISEYTRYDGLGLAALVRAGEVSREEPTSAAFRAMDVVNERLNAIVGRVDPPVGADHFDARAPFAGVPFVVKDLWHGWGGVVCNEASRLGEGFAALEDNALAARFRNAGLVVMGRGNTCELGLSGQTDPAIYGAARNPWDLSVSPGASSGGSAAAVAAGVVPIAHGNDGGGSIRMPAAFCGLVGLKPSRGRNPLGAPTFGDGAHPVVAHHVMSRSVRDNAAALDVSSGPKGGDFIPLARPQRSFLDEVANESGGLRIALCTRIKEASEADPICVAAARAAAALCETLGHEIEEATPEVGYQDIIDVCMDFYALSVVSSIDAMARATGRRPGPDTLEAPSLSTYEMGRRMSGQRVARRMEQLASISRVMGEFMRRFDVVLTPTTSMMPPEVGRYSAGNYTAGDLSYWADEGEIYNFLPLFSVSGQPAMSLPLYWSDDGMPVGVQIAGAIGEEAVLYRLAGQLERAAPWLDRRPGVFAS